MTSPSPSERFDAESGLMLYRHRFYHTGLGTFCSRDPIGHDGSEWNLYEYVGGRPLDFSDALGLACHLCTKLESITPQKDASGKVIGCVVKYRFDKDPLKKPKTIAGKSCPKDCEPVPTCDDIPNLEQMTVIKIKEPKKPFLGTATCPSAAELNPSYCFGVNAKNCKGDWEEEYRDCRDMCKRGGAAKHLCKGIRVPGLKQACEAMVNGSVDNCIYYCENSRVKRDDE